MKLSVVTTIYRSADCVEQFHERADRAANVIGAELETIFVNDGSPDDGLQVAQTLARRDSRVTVVDLSRNYGQHKALWTGTLLASGDLVAVLDGDLEEDPYWLVEFERTLRKEDVDVVFGVTAASERSLVYRLGREAFYRSVDFVTRQNFPRNITTARLMTRRYVEALRQFPEREVHPLGLWAIAGFRQIGVPVEKSAKSSTSYDLIRLLSVFTSGITSFSILPLTLVFVAGMLISAFAVLDIIYLFIQRFVIGVGVPGWTSVMALQLLIGGLLLFFNGIIAIYIGTIFLEVKERPRTIVRSITRSPSDPREAERS
jgi:putative glycosyltransferase